MSNTTLPERSTDIVVDQEQMIQSLQDFPDQLIAGWSGMQSLTLSTHYIQAQHVVILGVGASAIAGRIAQLFTRQSSAIPILCIENGTLPQFVSSKTLVLGISYRGDAPEVVSAFETAGRRGAKLLGISTGGGLGALCRKYRAPFYQIHYGTVPRNSLGYLVSATLSALQRLGFVEFENKQAVSEAFQSVTEFAANLQTTLPSEHNLSKKLAKSLQLPHPLLIASDYLLPVAYRLSQQCAQNAKRLIPLLSMSDVAHAAAEALLGQHTDYTLIQLRSEFDSPTDAHCQNLFGTQRRAARLSTEEYLLPAPSALAVQLHGILLADYASYYMALDLGRNPSATPQVDAFRAELARTA